MKKIIMSAGVLSLLALSGSTFAADIPYQMTSAGKIVSCVAKPAGVGLCKGFSIPSSSSNQYSYDNVAQVFTISSEDSDGIKIPFLNNIGRKTICSTLSMTGGSGTPEPIGYCQNASNNYALVAFTAEYVPASGAIGEKSTIDLNISGVASAKIKTDGTQYLPQS